MEQYIPKAAVVAEIKRLSAYLDTLHEQRIIEKILSIIDTIEVKEVDLEKEWKEFLKDGDVGYKEIAQHFFELGLSVSNKAWKEVEEYPYVGKTGKFTTTTK